MPAVKVSRRKNEKQIVVGDVEPDPEILKVGARCRVRGKNPGVWDACRAGPRCAALICYLALASLSVQGAEGIISRVISWRW